MKSLEFGEKEPIKATHTLYNGQLEAASQIMASKNSLSPYQAHKKRIIFIQRAIGEGVLDKIPIRTVSERNRNIALTYNLNDVLTGEDMGKMFPKPSGEYLTRSRINQIHEVFLRQMWNYASPQLQTCYPLEEILSRKEMAGSAYDDFEEKAKTLENYKELQELLDDFSDGSLLGYINHHRKDGERILIDLSSVLRKAEFYPRSNFIKLFVQKVKEKNIPIRRVEPAKKTKGKYIQANYIVYKKHEEEIANALKDDPNYKVLGKIQSNSSVEHLMENYLQQQKLFIKMDMKA